MGKTQQEAIAAGSYCTSWLRFPCPEQRLHSQMPSGFKQEACCCVPGSRKGGVALCGLFWNICICILSYSMTGPRQKLCLFAKGYGVWTPWSPVVTWASPSKFKRSRLTLSPSADPLLDKKEEAMTTNHMSPLPTGMTLSYSGLTSFLNTWRI